MSCASLIGLLMATLFVASPASAMNPAQRLEPPQPTESATADLVERASDAVKRGAFSEAISAFEQLSDRGYLNPDASYNRAVAYLQRAESAKQKPGDLGQAAAGLREAALLDRGGPSAEGLLTAVRQEVSHLRSRQGRDPVVVQPELGRALTSLVSEQLWGFVAALGSLALSLGLVLRRSSDATQRLAGLSAAYSGAVVLALFGALTLSAMRYRQTSQEAIVVVDEARLLDASGNALTAKALGVDTTAIPEGASVYITAQRGTLLSVSWGTLRAWVRRSDLRPLGPVQHLSDSL
ncbi:MAG: hypothetical protein RJA70_649 [Pseudomonadota bacterium]|jgi:hypothetical protein